MKKILPFLTLLLLLAPVLVAQTLPEYEQRIADFFTQIQHTTSTDTILQYNDSINALLDNALKMERSFSYPFAQLQYVGKVPSDDGALRIYTWNVPAENGFVYNGIVQTATGNTLHFRQAPSAHMPDENATIDPNNWYGALYYRAIAYKYQKTKVYLLIGLNRQTDKSQYKVIDVLSFDQTGRPALGLPLFNAQDRVRKRIVFEYDAETVMHVDYEPSHHRFMFDHLSPIKYYEDETVTFGPDMSVDAYVRKSKGFFLKEDIHVRNKRK